MEALLQNGFVTLRRPGKAEVWQQSGLAKQRCDLFTECLLPGQRVTREGHCDSADLPGPLILSPKSLICRRWWSETRRNRLNSCPKQPWSILLCQSPWRLPA